MSTFFQLGVLLLFLGAVQCKERIFSHSGLMIKTYKHDLQRGNETLSICHLCKKIVQEILKTVGEELSKDSIDKAFNKVCEKIGRVFEKRCLNLIKKYKDKLVNTIMSAQNTHDACKRASMCKNHKV